MHAVGLTLSTGYQNIEQPNIAIMGIFISLKLIDWLQVLFVAWIEDWLQVLFLASV